MVGDGWDVAKGKVLRFPSDSQVPEYTYDRSRGW